MNTDNKKRLAQGFFAFAFTALLGYFYITFGPIAIPGAVVVGVLGVWAIKNA